MSEVKYNVAIDDNGEYNIQISVKEIAVKNISPEDTSVLVSTKNDGIFDNGDIKIGFKEGRYAFVANNPAGKPLVGWMSQGDMNIFKMYCQKFLDLFVDTKMKGDLKKALTQ